MKNTSERPSFKLYGRPTAIPSGSCPVCSRLLQNEEVGFCEVDWRWEHKSHLRTQMHGNLDEVSDRKEPIVLKTYKFGQWVTEKV